MISGRSTPGPDVILGPLTLHPRQGMGIKEYEKFMSADGLLNEFAMMWALRDAFPLH